MKSPWAWIRLRGSDCSSQSGRGRNRVGRLSYRPRTERLEDRRLMSVAIAETGLTPSPNNSLDVPRSIVMGPDGNIWFTEDFAGKIGRLTPGGKLTEFNVPGTPGETTEGITVGPDGNLWFTITARSHCAIARITTQGALTVYPTPFNQSNPAAIALGPDGNLWFTERNSDGHDRGAIGRITTQGVFAEFPLPTTQTSPDGITSGPDGNIWFTEVGKIGRVNPQGVITEFAVPPSSTGPSYPMAITAGP